MRIVVRLLSFTLLATVARAEAAPTPTPAWTFRPAFAARVGYDDNVFLQDRSAILPGVTGAVPNRAGSWVARASLALETGWQASPALQFNAGYSPELVRYEAYSSEHHDNHRLLLSLLGKQGAWSYQLKGSLLYVDGAETSPIFGQAGGGPAIGGVPVRDRRDQINTKLGGQLTRTFDGGFLRAAGDLCVNDYHTRHVSTALVPGYANYVDRSEWSTGLDAGRFVAKEFALVAGVRVGEQRQADLLGVSHNYSNTLTRFLVGVEGRPRSDLLLRIVGGPDLRHFGDAAAPGFDRTRTTRYVEASAIWTPSATDTVTFTGKDYLWLSGGGRCAYHHTGSNLRWDHTFNAVWSMAVLADVQVGDSRDYGASAVHRLDWIYTGTLGVTRTLGSKTKLDLELLREWGESAIADKPGREYTRWIATVGVRRVF